MSEYHLHCEMCKKEEVGPMEIFILIGKKYSDCDGVETWYVCPTCHDKLHKAIDKLMKKR